MTFGDDDANPPSKPHAVNTESARSATDSPQSHPESRRDTDLEDGRRRLRLAVLISGGGRTLRNLIERADDGRLPATINLVVSSRADAGGLAYATSAGVPSYVVPFPKGTDTSGPSAAVFDLIRQSDVDLVVLGGFLKQLQIPHDYLGRVVNIHPSLIPAFCGHGLYGEHVHRAAIAYGVKISGCTVHYVDQDYDHGPVILQRPVAVEDGDTPETLAARVFAAECEALPDAIARIASGSITLDGRRVVRTKTPAN